MLPLPLLSPELELEAESEELDDKLFAAASIGFGSRTMIAKLTGFSERWRYTSLTYSYPLLA